MVLAKVPSAALPCSSVNIAQVRFKVIVFKQLGPVDGDGFALALEIHIQALHFESVVSGFLDEPVRLGEGCVFRAAETNLEVVFMEKMPDIRLSCVMGPGVRPQTSMVRLPWPASFATVLGEEAI